MSLTLPVAAVLLGTTLAVPVQDRALSSFERSGVPGMVAVVTHGDRIVWSGGFGTASDGSRMTSEAVVQVGSLTKSLTATTVLQLAEAGRVDLDASLAAQLPESSLDDRITVRQLLNHTSGLTDADTHYWHTIDEGARTTEEVTATLRGAETTTEPGTRHRYANVNYVLAGRLVEVVTGRPFAQVVQSDVLTPHEMRSSRLDRDGAPAGSNSVFGTWVAREDASTALDDDPTGSLVTTADDLGRWLIATNGAGTHPLSPFVRAGLQHTTTASGSYGAGWAQDGDLAGWWGHSGNRYTYSAAMLREPVEGWGVAVVVNGASMSDPAYPIAQDLAALVSGAAPMAVPDALLVDRWSAAAAGIGLLAGVVGVVRARRWAGRRRGRPLLTVLGLVWLVPPVLLATLAPQLASFLLGGIDLTWGMLTYYSLTPLVALLAMGAVSAAVLLRRSWFLLRAWGRAT